MNIVSAGKDNNSVQVGAQRITKSDDNPKNLVVMNYSEILTLQIKPREELLAPWLLTQSLNMIYAWRGTGKTHIALGIAYAVASGGTFLNWSAPKPSQVLYIDGEMPASELQNRINGIDKSNNIKPPDADYLRIITPDFQASGMPDLATLQGQEKIETLLNDTKLLIIDNLSCLVRGTGNENEAESWMSIQAWALKQRANGRSIIFIHHSGKSGQQRGTSKKEDLLDCVISLRQPSDYNAADGAVFEIRFDKARNLRGEAAQSIEAKLTTDENNTHNWAYRPVEVSTMERVVALTKEGLSQSDIALELGINKSTVSRAMKKAKADGLINLKEEKTS